MTPRGADFLPSGTRSITGEAKVSGNVWAMRCVEHCLEGFPNEMTAIWSIARGLTAPWGSDKNEDAEVDFQQVENHGEGA